MTEKSRSASGRKSKSGARKKSAGTRKKTAAPKTSAGKKNATAGSRKKSGKKTTASRSGQRRKWTLKGDLLVFLGIVAMVLLIAGYYRFHLKPAAPTGQSPSGQARQSAPARSGHPSDPVKVITPQTLKKDFKPDFEIFPPRSAAPPAPEDAPVVPPPAPDADRRPLVAIIIDDLGYEMDVAEKFLSLNSALTYAILPESPFCRQIAESAHRRGCQIMLHLPMEPREYPEADPGPGALLSDMSADERIGLLKKHLDSVPYVAGVNNHMGSKMSADSAQMNQVLSVVKQRQLFYIDSLTAPDSRSDSSARLFQVPFARRDIFLDHVPEPGFIRNQVRHLVAVAHKKGRAVGIGHPYPATYDVLRQMLPEIQKQVRMVPASRIVSTPGT